MSNFMHTQKQMLIFKSKEDEKKAVHYLNDEITNQKGENYPLKAYLNRENKYQHDICIGNKNGIDDVLMTIEHKKLTNYFQKPQEQHLKHLYNALVYLLNKDITEQQAFIDDKHEVIWINEDVNADYYVFQAKDNSFNLYAWDELKDNIKPMITFNQVGKYCDTLGWLKRQGYDEKLTDNLITEIYDNVGIDKNKYLVKDFRHDFEMLIMTLDNLNYWLKKKDKTMIKQVKDTLRKKYGLIQDSQNRVPYAVNLKTLTPLNIVEECDKALAKSQCKAKRR